MDADVSVIVPAFESPYLREALASVFSQTVQPREIIVVDSSPETTLPQIANDRERIRYCFQPPRGVSAARNAGIGLSQGQYIALLDADDLWLPNKLELQMRAFDRYPSAGFCFAPIWNLCDAGDPSIPQETFLPLALEKWTQKQGAAEGVSCGDLHSVLLQVNCIGTSSLMIRRPLLENELFDEKLKNGEDYDFELRLAKRREAIFLRQPVSRYRIHARGLSGSWENRPQIFYDSNLKVLRKHLRTEFSAEALRSLAKTYHEYAGWRLTTAHTPGSTMLALKSFCLWPNTKTFKLLVESCAPAPYRRISKIAAKARRQ